MKLRFSGHETFICKQLWPKKGYDFLKASNKFTDVDAVLKLGVGKNMVNSIHFWLKAMNLIEENDRINEIAKIIIDDKGFDPYMEDIGTIWILHYLLISSDYSSLYSIIFNEFLKIRNEFTRESLQNYIQRLSTTKKGNSNNSKTVKNDISVFLRNYLPHENTTHNSKNSNIEDDYSGLFQELRLIKQFNQQGLNNNIEKYYLMDRKERTSLPKEIFLFSILSNKQIGESVSLNELVSGYNSVGNVFLMSRNGIYKKIEELLNAYGFITYTQTGGISVLQFEKKPKPLDIIEKYYEGNTIHAIN